MPFRRLLHKRYRLYIYNIFELLRANFLLNLAIPNLNIFQVQATLSVHVFTPIPIFLAYLIDTLRTY